MNPCYTHRLDKEEVDRILGDSRALMHNKVKSIDFPEEYTTLVMYFEYTEFDRIYTLLGYRIE